MAVELQSKLLRVIQEREVERLGSQAAIPLDVRSVATTNRDLAEAVRDGRFREDLVYRLSVFPLRIPPLRERREDIIPLAEHLLARATAAAPMSPALSSRYELTPGARRRLADYDWPGNVRELDNVMQRALVLSDDGVIDESALVFESASLEPRGEPLPDGAQGRTGANGAPIDADTLGAELRHSEHRAILDALSHCRGSKKDAAQRLGVSPRTLRYKLARMRESGIDV